MEQPNPNTTPPTDASKGQNARVLAALEQAYLLVLQIPMSALRINNQATLCSLRDTIAELRGVDPQDVQNEFESRLLEMVASNRSGRKPGSPHM